jgi:hypothetical protein
MPSPPNSPGPSPEESRTRDLRLQWTIVVLHWMSLLFLLCGEASAAAATEALAETITLFRLSIGGRESDR